MVAGKLECGGVSSMNLVDGDEKSISAILPLNAILNARTPITVIELT
jgi:hypothetical protein